MVVKSKRGFTLIEALVAIVVVGILAGIIAVALSQTRFKQARDAVRKNDLKVLLEGLHFYYLDNDYTYPGVVQEYYSSDGIRWIQNLGADYIKELPVGPKFHNKVPGVANDPDPSSCDNSFFCDDFNGSQFDLLTAHTPDVGSGWVIGYQYNANGPPLPEGQLDTNGIKFRHTETGWPPAKGVLMIADDVVSSVDYSVSVEMDNVAGSSITNTLVARWEKSESETYANAYGWRFGKWVSGLYKSTESGGWSQRSSCEVPVPGINTYTLKVVGDTITGFIDGVQAGAGCIFTDPDPITGAGKGGVGHGAVIVSTDGLGSQTSDNFKIWVAGGGVACTVDYADYYTYVVDETNKNYALWACLEYEYDEHIYDGSNPVCESLKPTVGVYNYCVTAPY